MPAIQKPGQPFVVFTETARLSMPLSVQDDDLTLRVRAIGRDMQVAAELYSLEHDSCLTVTLPRMTPGAAMQLAVALLEVATGRRLDLDVFIGEDAPP